jgi:hypothetical protein
MLKSILQNFQRFSPKQLFCVGPPSRLARKRSKTRRLAIKTLICSSSQVAFTEPAFQDRASLPRRLANISGLSPNYILEEWTSRLYFYISDRISTPRENSADKDTARKEEDSLWIYTKAQRDRNRALRLGRRGGGQRSPL